MWTHRPAAPRAGGSTRPGRAELRRGGEAASLPERLGDLRVDLELGERRPRAHARPVDAPRNRPAEVHERIRVRQPVAEERDELGAAGERDVAVAEEAG